MIATPASPITSEVRLLIQRVVQCVDKFHEVTLGTRESSYGQQVVDLLRKQLLVAGTRLYALSVFRRKNFGKNRCKRCQDFVYSEYWNSAVVAVNSVAIVEMLCDVENGTVVKLYSGLPSFSAIVYRTGYVALGRSARRRTAILHRNQNVCFRRVAVNLLMPCFFRLGY